MIKAIRGMNDILPADTPAWRFVEDAARDLLAGYGYEEIRPPLIEHTELFQRSIGEVTDIVEKEMYTFADRNGDSLTLRPECTASCVRAAIEHGLLRGAPRRLWATGPMFRHERPQKGRYRQFHQIDVEVIGMAEPAADAELVLVSSRLWRRLGLADLRLDINTLGNRAVQAAYRTRLVEHFGARREHLDEDSRRRLETNPLRILDSKNPEMRPLLDEAPVLVDHLDADSRAHFESVLGMLDDAGVPYRLNPRLVRGLDYYTGVVFEWVTEELGAQSAVCGGGRYDGLVEEVGGPPTPATGFAIGLERLVELARVQGVLPEPLAPHCYLVAVGDAARRAAHAVAERLRDGLPRTRIVVDAAAGSFRSKMRRADRSGARLALVLGDDEMREARVGVRDLRADSGQRSVGLADLAEHVARRLREAPAVVAADSEAGA